jgi:hypothetical protein
MGDDVYTGVWGGGGVGWGGGGVGEEEGLNTNISTF